MRHTVCGNEHEYLKLLTNAQIINYLKTHDKFDDFKELILRENKSINHQVKEESNFNQIVGSSFSLKKVLSQVNMVADTEATVLIRGETGTGKELIAQAIHKNSSRRDGPLVKVNCPAIPTGLLESELYGHEKGAFTGALHKKIGKFELAHSGTIFLDELGELPLDAQAKLLRVLQEKEFERVGGTETIRVDLRVIAATNRDLEAQIEEGKFRRDLYYRLNVFPIAVPSLSERIEDVPLLAKYFTHKYARILGKDIKSISDEAMNRLKSYRWPGNIRELENIIERALILSHGEEVELEKEHFGRLFESPSKHSGDMRLEHIERSHITNILDQTRWRINGERGAAKILGINPNTLRSRMVKLGIKKKLIGAG